MGGQFERHARSKWEWGQPGSRSAEVRDATQSDPDPAKRAPGKKNTKRWCKGKPGVQHTPEIVLWHTASYWSRRGCGWGPSWSSPGTIAWRCSHREQCSACGKVLRDVWTLKTECPAYPGTDAQREVAQREADEEVRWRAQRPSRARVITGPQGYRRKSGKMVQ